MDTRPITANPFMVGIRARPRALAMASWVASHREAPRERRTSTRSLPSFSSVSMSSMPRAMALMVFPRAMPSKGMRY